MQIKYKLLILLCSVSLSVMAGPAIQFNAPTLNNSLDKIDDEYAIKKALFREIYTNGVEKAIAQVTQQKLAKKTWGVVFALDGTLLDEVHHLANPGSTQVTCKIQQLGGNVVIVTQRGNGQLGNTDFIAETSNNLKEQGICFDSIVFANNAKDSNKNPRFIAINSGDYENITMSKRLPPIQIVAYFGSKIQDFPDLKQNLANTSPISDSMFSNFGQKYFMLPR